MRVQELRETRTARVMEMRGLVETAEKEKRDLNDVESRRFDSLKAEVSGIETRIGQAETLASLERYAEGTPVGGNAGGTDLATLEARYSIGKAIQEYSDTGKLTGVEGEYAAERRTDRSKGFAAPVSLFLGGERRYVGTQQPAAGPGGVLVSTDLGPLTDRPRPNLAVQKLGATTLSGLTGNLDMPRLKSSGTAYWVAEHAPTTGSDPTFDKFSMGPKTVTGRYEMTRRMMIQAPQIEQILRFDLGWIIAAALDAAAVMGPGINDMPRGIQSTPGVRKVPGAYATPGSPTVSELDNLFATMASLVEDADLGGATGFLAHPLVKATLNRYRTSTGDLIGLDGFLKGEPAAWSTQIPASLGVGTNLAKIFYGNWPDLIIGYWSSVDIMLNPYAKEMADRGGAYLYAFLDADIAVRHPESFCFTDDFPTTQNSSSVVVS